MHSCACFSKSRRTRNDAPGLFDRAHYLRPWRKKGRRAVGTDAPDSPDPLFATLARGGSLSLREGVPVLDRRPRYLRHLRDAGRSVCERQGRSGQTGGSVCERECRSRVAGPIIYGTSARRLSQFARGSAGPGSLAPLFTILVRGGSLSLREVAPVRQDGSLSLREGVPVLGRRPHYLRHLREAGRSVCER